MSTLYFIFLFFNIMKILPSQNLLYILNEEINLISFILLLLLFYLDKKKMGYKFQQNNNKTNSYISF